MNLFSKLALGSVLVAATASPAAAERIFGLRADNTIITFDSATPTTLTSTGAITGLPTGTTLVGLDLRVSNRTLYTLSTAGELYTVAASGANYVATSVGTLTTMPSGFQFGFDFNPVPDRLRVVSNNGQNLRINPNDPELVGGTIVDGNVNTTEAQPISVLGVAYTNNVAGATSTVLYGVNDTRDRLVRSTNPNAGTYVSTNLNGDTFAAFGPAVSLNLPVGFDISGTTGNAFVSVANRFYQVDLTTGQGDFLGNVGGFANNQSPRLIGITAGAIPEPGTWALMIAGFGLVGVAMRRRAGITTIAA